MIIFLKAEALKMEERKILPPKKSTIPSIVARQKKAIAIVINETCLITEEINNNNNSNINPAIPALNKKYRDFISQIVDEIFAKYIKAYNAIDKDSKNLAECTRHLQSIKKIKYFLNPPETSDLNARFDARLSLLDSTQLKELNRIFKSFQKTKTSHLYSLKNELQLIESTIANRIKKQPAKNKLVFPVDEKSFSERINYNQIFSTYRKKFLSANKNNSQSHDKEILSQLKKLKELENNWIWVEPILSLDKLEKESKQALEKIEQLSAPTEEKSTANSYPIEDGKQEIRTGNNVEAIEIQKNESLKVEEDHISTKQEKILSNQAKKFFSDKDHQQCFVNNAIDFFNENQDPNKQIDLEVIHKQTIQSLISDKANAYFPLPEEKVIKDLFINLCNYHLNLVKKAGPLGKNTFNFAIDSAERHLREILKNVSSFDKLEFISQYVPGYDLNYVKLSVDYIMEGKGVILAMKMAKDVITQQYNVVSSNVKTATETFIANNYTAPGINGDAFKEYAKDKILDPNWNSQIENVKFFFKFKHDLIECIFDQMSRVAATSESKLYFFMSKEKNTTKYNALYSYLDKVDNAKSPEELFTVVENMLANENITLKRNVFGLFASKTQKNLESLQLNMASEWIDKFQPK